MIQISTQQVLECILVIPREMCKIPFSGGKKVGNQNQINLEVSDLLSSISECEVGTNIFRAEKRGGGKASV